MSNLFSNYLAYTAETEPPIIYHRWSYLTTLGAAIGRKTYLHHGHWRIFPTVYIMLLGEPAARKSTAIKMAKKLFAAAGYSNFSADKSTKEKFLLDLEGTEGQELGDEDELTSNGRSRRKVDSIDASSLWGDDRKEPREVFIVADEFNEFAGAGNMEFYTTLGNLWDFDSPSAPFTQRVKNSRSVSIHQPTISILSGNTPELFARAFPPEAIGSGFLSRLMLIHGERSGRKITFPPPPDPKIEEGLIAYLVQLQNYEGGALEIAPGAKALLDTLYQHETDYLISDIRFKGFNNRRFTQLLKLCVLITGAQFKKEIQEEDVFLANTILSHAEILMPKAMGEFGKNKNSDVSNKIVTIIEKANRPVSTRELWMQVSRDLGAQKDLMDLLNGLLAADRLQVVQGRHPGFLPKKVPRKEHKWVDWTLLTQEERDMI